MRALRFSAFLLAACGSLFLSCVSAPAGSPAKAAPGKAVTSAEDVEAACFEVVEPKCEVDSLAYEKPLDWSLVSYRDRNDKFQSLGTAFAVSPTELVTASHVLSLEDGSPFYPQRFIRERRIVDGHPVEKTYELDKVVAFDTKKDYVVFTVKGRTFDRWFEAAASHEFNKGVSTAGFAYGEGLVVRPGTLLEYVPEEDKGEWSYLKSSAQVNPGNSGGPLFDAKRRVVGVVLARKDDFCYSLPIADLKRGDCRSFRRLGLGFTAFSDRLMESATASYPLPLGYRDLMDRAAADYKADYGRFMDKLFASLNGEVFPDGSTSLNALYSSGSSVFPQIYLKATDNKEWFCSDLKPSRANIGDDGEVSVAKVHENAAAWLIRVKRPTTQSAADLFRSPKRLMDTVLKGINITRKLSDKDPGVRVISFGAPRDTSAFPDRWGRLWRMDVWSLEYLDRAALTLELPTPDGAVLLYFGCGAAEMDLLRYDLKRLADLISVSYLGTLDEWTAFLPRIEAEAPQLRGLSLSWAPGGELSLKAGPFALDKLKPAFPLLSSCRLGVYYDIYLQGGKPADAPRRIVLDDGLNDGDYLSAYRWVKPEGQLLKGYFDDWKTFIEGRGTPYNGAAFLEAGKSGIGAVLDASLTPDGATTVFIHRGSTVADAKMKGDLDALIAAFAPR